jgi:hypothetical protein
MDTTATTLKQRTRLLILILYVVGLLITSRLALGAWLPPRSEKGVWFYSALAALLLGNLLVTPYFRKPTNSISYSVAAAIALLAVNPWGRTNYIGFDCFLWSSAMGYTGVVFLAGIFTIALKDSQRVIWQKFDKSCFLVSDTLGNPRAIFSVIFLFALVTFHRSSPREYIIIGFAWAVFVGLRPLESIAGLFRRFSAVWSTEEATARLGTVVGHETPGLVLIREETSSAVSFGDLLYVRNESGKPGIAVALDHVGFTDGRWLRAQHLCSETESDQSARGPSLVRDVAEGSVFFADKRKVSADTNSAVDDICKRLLGLVAPDTAVGTLQVEVVRADLDLQLGSLIQVNIGSRTVLYQTIEGITKEEILHQKNTRGFVRAVAKKIGCWNSANTTFESVPWLPQPNAPVFLAPQQTPTPKREAIGHFPQTDYTVRIDPQFLVTHNAAILGILGVGKTFLALELVERMVDAGIKVICLDLTDQYSQQLAAFYKSDAESAFMTELNGIGLSGKTNCNKNVEEGGSVRPFEAKLKEHLTAFLGPAGTDKLLIFNPARFEVWRQDSKPFQNVASMATLTPTEITRVITEVALGVLQAQGMTDRARCCLVYEEAHSLIPEWNAVAAEGDKAATNGTAKAILQGRKFGLGCLVITQRTANVTKSILNQCNTIFALRVFDATGMEFLKNYIGNDYAGVLSSLMDRHAVIFGRASSCKDPVLLRLNDRDEFLKIFRKQISVESV